jgi:prephenate dehydrogenase
MIVGIVGLGLVGGSLGLALKRSGFADAVLGVEQLPHHAAEATKLHLVDEVRPLSDVVHGVDLLILAVPVRDISAMLPLVLDSVKEGAIVVDMGSTKGIICESVRHHPRRSRFVAAHPIAGTENTGPGAAIPDLFAGKLAIVCEDELSDDDALALVRRMFESLHMRLVMMDAETHDRHLAYVSHISHITSFVLATTVLEIEKSATTIFDLAGSGFESTVRLAKSSPAMWAPIFEQNAEHVCEALDAYIRRIAAFRDAIRQNDSRVLEEEMTRANEIRRVLAGMNGKSQKPPSQQPTER